MFRFCLLAAMLATVSVHAQIAATTSANPIGERLPLSSAGLAPAVRSSSLDFLSANPALRVAQVGWTANLGLQGEHWTGIAGTQRQVKRPGEVAMQWGGERIALQAGWTQLYDFDLVDKMMVTTPLFPNGTGETVDYKYRSRLQALCLGLSGEWPLTGDMGRLRAGLRLEQAWWEYDAGVDGTPSMHERDRDLRPVIGLAWVQGEPHGSGWSLGAVWSGDLTMEWNHETVRPATVELGAAWRLASGGRLDLQATRADWNDAIGRGDNGVDWSASWSQPLRAGLRGLAGAVTNGYHASTDGWYEDHYDSVFLVLGAEWRLGATALELLVADNRISGADWNQRTVV